MNGSQDQVFASINKLPFALGIASPKHKDNVRSLIIKGLYSSVREFLPTFSLMTTRFVSFHREGGIKQEYPLFSPMGKVARRRDWFAQIAVEFLINIDQRWWSRHTLLHREAKPMCLIYIMIGVLPDNHHAHFVKRTKVKSTKNMLCRWETLARGISMAHKVGEQLEVRFVELGLQDLSPALVNTHIHRVSR